MFYLQNIALYYNSVSTSSTEIYTYYYTVLYSQSVVSMYNVNANIDMQYDMATNEDLSSMMLTMLMPMLLTMLLFTGCLAIATESIAGEKERGTMATMLVTPVKRSHIAIGKIIALSIFSY